MKCEGGNKDKISGFCIDRVPDLGNYANGLIVVQAVM